MSTTGVRTAEVDPARESSDVSARLSLAVGRLNRRLRPAKPELSHGLLMALSTIVRQGPLRPREIAAVEQVAAPTATRLVVVLEERGLVSRTPDPDDGRSFFVSATADGRDAILAARLERAETASELMAELDPDERRLIVAALGALERAAGVS